MNSIVLGIGSNTFYNELEPIDLLANACILLKKIIYKPKFSSIYETKALYYENQQNFFNMVVSGFLDDFITPYVLLDKIHEIENMFGRNRSKEIRFGPRPLDIDIEEFNSIEMNESDLILPHPRLKERQFVLIPMLEILSKTADCNRRKQVISFLEKLPDQGITKCNDEIQLNFKKLIES